MRKYRQEIEKYIDEHRDEMVADIIKLCSINSTRGEYVEGAPFGEGPKRALTMALSIAEKYGFDITNYDNYVGAIDLNNKEKGLDILAHLDVVPEGEGWSVTAPFEPKEIDGKIYGRGTSDDKGPAVAALFALRAVKDLNIPVKKNTRLVLGTDEECGSSCIKYYYTKEKEAPMTFSPDGEFPVVNIEKGQLQGEFSAALEDAGEKRLVSIEAGTKVNVVPPKAKAVIEGFGIEEVEAKAKEVTKETGIQFKYDLVPVFEITALGANAHASTPENGNNAITGLLELLCRLDFSPSKKIETIKKLYALMPHGDTKGEAMGIAVEDERSGALTLAFSMLTLKNNIMHGFFDSRIPVSGDGDKILKTVREKFTGIDVEFLNDSVLAPHEVDGNSPFVKTLLSIYEDYTGLKGECIAMGGGTYVHNIENGVAFGAVFPGTDTKMHGADEFVVIDELIASAKIFAQSIVELCN